MTPVRLEPPALRSRVKHSTTELPPVQWNGTSNAILKEGIMRNIHVKLYDIWASGSGVDVIQRYFLSGALAALLFSGGEPFVQFW